MAMHQIDLPATLGVLVADEARRSGRTIAAHIAHIIEWAEDHERTSTPETVHHFDVTLSPAAENLLRQLGATPEDLIARRFSRVIRICACGYTVYKAYHTRWCSVCEVELCVYCAIEEPNGGGNVFCRQHGIEAEVHG